jgi:hypothetical protein
VTREAIAVEAVFSEEGRITPRQFKWQGTWLAVEGIGRRWAQDDQRCFNVQALGGRLFVLRFDPLSGCWSIDRGPIPPIVV